MGQPSRVLFGLQHERCHGAVERRFGNPFRAVTAELAGDLAATGGMPHHDGVPEVYRFE
jgi:hypothetical protein